ncbi:MAG: hypothetical protein R3C24_15855 [Cyanobacteriota/Melainabacteria group bacterium]
MTEVSVEKYLLYALQQLKTLEEDMSVLTTHSAKADPEIIEELLDEIITRTMVPALEKLGVEDPLTEIQEEIDPSDIFEEELERITDELEEEEEEEEEAALID